MFRNVINVIVAYPFPRPATNLHSSVELVVFIRILRIRIQSDQFQFCSQILCFHGRNFQVISIVEEELSYMGEKKSLLGPLYCHLKQHYVQEQVPLRLYVQKKLCQFIIFSTANSRSVECTRLCTQYQHRLFLCLRFVLQFFSPPHKRSIINIKARQGKSNRVNLFRKVILHIVEQSTTSSPFE